MGGFFVTGKTPEKWRLIWHFSHLQSTLYRPSLSRSALALAYGVWSICWRATAPGSKSQGMKQLMAGGGIIVIGTTLIPLLSGLF
jgi:hypothetical protein